MDKRGFGLTLDAVISMLFIIAIVLALSAYRYTDTTETSRTAYLNLHSVSEDILDVLNRQGILDEVGSLWVAGNTTNASSQMMSYLDTLVPPAMGYRVMFDDSTLAENQRVPESSAVAETYSVRLLAGYVENKSVFGSTARAFLTGISGKSSSAYAYFGGFEGQGNLTKYLDVPSGVTITSAYMEMSAGSAFRLYVNGNDRGLYSPSGGGMSANIKRNLTGSWFTAGRNTVELRFAGSDISSQYVGGGFMKVTYNTSRLAEAPDTGQMTYYFPGIDGVINHYASIYVPGALNSMSAHLVYYNNYTTFFRIGGTLVNSTRGSPGAQTVDLSDSYLRTKLNYNELSASTVPIRLGTSNISRIVQEGNADVVLITDLSGSMDWRISSDSAGTQRSCNDSNLLSGTTKRVSLAKCLDKQFVSMILNGTGNRVGLVGFNDNADSSSYNLDFSSSNATVISKIDSYPNSPSGGTCICCALNKAYGMFEQQETAVPAGSGQWKMTSFVNQPMTLIAAGSSWSYLPYSSCGNSCNPASSSTPIPGSCTPPAQGGQQWYRASFNDTAWSPTTLPKVDDNLQQNVYYFRKHFTITSSDFTAATLSVRNKRGVQCYLNGNLIGTDTFCSLGNVPPPWTNTWSVPAAYFNAPGQDNVLACRARSAQGTNKGLRFDAQLLVTYSCGDSCDPATAPSFCTPSPGDWKSESFSDSAWSTVTLPKESASEQYMVFYYRKHFTLASDAAGNGTLYIRNRRGVECYLNGNLIGTDTACTTGNYWDHAWSFPATYFHEAGQDNVLACRLRAGSTSSRNGIEFDAKLLAPSDKRRYIILMSDGVTGYCCGGSYSCNTQGTGTAGSYSDCSGNAADCDGSQCDGAIANAVWSAQRNHDDLSVIINSVGFGPVATCTNGRYTLQQSAATANGTYCASTDPVQLQDCYIQFAREILEASVRSQTINITGSATPSTLYPSSYITFNYTPLASPLGYGEISLSYDTPRFNDVVNCQGSMYLPATAVAIEAKVTSYSAEHWADWLGASPGGYAWSLADFGSDYFQLGDPFIIDVPVNYVLSGGNNTFSVRTGDTPGNHTGCSADDRAILKIKLSGATQYGDVLPTAEGCAWTIEFEDGSTMQAAIPDSYSGANTCLYTRAARNATAADAVADATYRLLQKLDLDSDGEVDITFDPTQVSLDFSRVGGVRSLWGPAQLRLIVWI